MTYRTKKTLLRPEVKKRDARLFVVATEGAKTESRYFELFHSDRLKVEIIPCKDDKSAPNHILENLNIAHHKYDIGHQDELWLVIDVDDWKPEMLSSVCSECISKGFGIAVSNPCFEIWIAAHIDDISSYKEEDLKCQIINKKIRKILGSYSKSNFDAEQLRHKIMHAIEQCKKLEKNPNARWPKNGNSHLYKLVEKLSQLSK